MAQPQADPVEVLLTRLKKIGTECYLDGDDRPCVRIKDDPSRKDWRMCGESGRPSVRMRAFLRAQYRLETERQGHLGDAKLLLALDYLIEEAFRAGGSNTRTGLRSEGDYNFEAVVVFVGTLTEHQPGVRREPETGKLVYEARTAELWLQVNAKAIEVQVRAAKRTFYKALNFFSRRLTELKDQFRKEGLEVTVTHKEDGSWVTVARDDQICHPAPALLVTDGEGTSASAVPSGSKTGAGKKLEETDATQMETEDPK